MIEDPKEINSIIRIDENNYFYFSKLKIYLHRNVYEPAEDTFFLLESIHIKPNQKIFELGAGTGIISLFCAQKKAEVICSDINPFAVKLIKKNIEVNQNKIYGSVEVRNGDLFTILMKHELFDYIIFNPPYLPTIKEQKRGIPEWYIKSFDGGKSGLSTIIRFLKGLKHHLKDNGKAIFIVSSLSNVKELYKTFTFLSIKHKIINSLRCDEEILFVYQASF
jgi:release factor glutamine methyltransferase